MRTTRPFLFLLGLWVLAIAVSCTPPQKKACTADDVCAKDEICELGRCITGCRTKQSCPAEHYCREKKCTKQSCKPGTQRECYDGPKGTKDKGTCKAGEQFCLDDGEAWSPCYTQQPPTKEICDNRDNDCDGEVDEKLDCACTPGQLRLCYTGGTQTAQVGLCRQGVQYCTEKRKWGQCRDQRLPRPEICDGLDNDCNGEIDDRLRCDCKPGTERPCYSGKASTKQVGRCRQGTQVCNKSGIWSTCKHQVMPDLEEFQRPEICNGKDDNCDGLVDNVSSTQERLKRLCYTGDTKTLRKGPCKQGIQTCQTGKWGACVGEVTPKPEECNAKDDDCNGLIDDNLKPQACVSSRSGCTATPNGSYQCLGSCQVGSQRCENGKWTACTGEVLPAAQENCGNNKDDDCNGQVDDKCICKIGDKRDCYTGTKETKGRGLCNLGKQTCENNKWGACVGEGSPQSEICNGKDDDCDGEIDNLQKSCPIPGKQGRCAQGVLLCVQGKKTCQANKTTTEVCSGEDNDCDGEIDNIPDRGKPCTDNTRNGICAAGKWQCVNKQKVCVATIKPGSTLEICNNKDDNCDGKIDNVQGTCTISGQQGICAAGIWICSNNAKQCKPQNQKTVEICNGKDDDCNGIIDDIPELNDPCQDKTRFGICRPGQWRCISQKKVCKQLVLAKAKEECNKLDDTCDGKIDEGCNTCQSNRNCKASEFCINGYCVTGSCLTDADCKSGQVCRNLQCISCTKNSDCPTGKFCDSGVCKDFQCRVNSQCPRGLVCNAQLRCAPCSKSADCGTNRTCRNGVCYKVCTLSSDCSSNEVCSSNKQCYQSCTQDADCDSGFGCASSACWVTTKLDNGAYKWTDNSFPTSCTGYRFGKTGYKPSLITGAYWIKLPKAPNGAAIKVFCDMTTDGGGWTLLAKYNSQLLLKDYNILKHQQQDKAQGKTRSTAPDLNQPTTYGHIQFDHWSPATAEVRLDCRTSPTGQWFSSTHHRLFDSWTPGLRGVYGTKQQPSRYSDYPGWGVIAQKGKYSRSSTLCGVSTDSSASSGIAYCNDRRLTHLGLFVNHKVSLAFQTNGVLTIGCNGTGLSGSSGQWEGRIWIRVPGTNPVQLTNDVRRWKDGTSARSCLEYYNSVGGQYSGQTGSGVYQIKPEPSMSPIQVYCDMRNRGAGWTLAFLKNARSGRTSLKQSLTNYTKTSHLARTPEAAALSKTSREGWLNLNTFPYSQFYFGLYDRPEAKNKCIESVCADFYSPILKTQLKQKFGFDGLLLDKGIDVNKTSIRYSWCGGNVYKLRRCLGRPGDWIGAGWYIIQYRSSLIPSRTLLICGSTSDLGRCSGMLRNLSNNRLFRAAGSVGTAAAMWVR